MSTASCKSSMMDNMPEGLCSRCKEFISLPKEPPTSTTPPSLAHLSQTNAAPPLAESEVEDLKKSRERVRYSIAELDDQIRDLTLALEKFRVERVRLKGIDDEYTSSLSPIRRIPSEILSEIFLHAQNKYHQVCDASSPSWVLSWVCRSWRTIVVNCSEFWCMLGICPHLLKVTENATPLLRTTISRARERKLVLSLRFSRFPYWFPTDEEIISILDVLMESSERWFIVNIMNLPSKFLPFFAPIRGRLGSLEDLSIECVDSLTLDFRINAFEVAPKLQSAWIVGFEGTMISLPPCHLLEFCDRRPYGDDALNGYFLDIIRNAPDLHTFMVALQPTAASVDGVFSIAPRILHPNIRVLHACEGSFLRSLTLPQLEHMCLAVGDEYAICPQNSLLGLHDLLQHSHCSLRSLRIVHAWPLEGILTDILPLIPSLEDFYFSIKFGWEGDTNTIMQTLISGMSDQDENHRLRLVPGLRNLDLVVSSPRLLPVMELLPGPPVMFCDTVFVNTISRRWNPVVGERILQRVHMEAYPGMEVSGSLSQHEQDQLEVCRGEGLDISIHIGEIRYV